MNPVTFNDPFEKPVIEMVGQDVWRKMAVAPLFDYTVRLAGLEEHLEKGRAAFADEEGRYKYPFDILRLSFTAGATDPAAAVVQAHKQNLVFASSVPETKAIDDIVPWLSDSKANGFVTYDVMLLSTGLIFFRIKNLSRQFGMLERIPFFIKLEQEEGGEGQGPRINCGAQHGFEILWYNNGAWREIKSAKASVGQHLRSLKHTAATAITAFAFDAMTPTNHQVEIRPDKPGKSVEWTKARTHYTLITHGHPANRPMREGAIVEADREGELTRMAHNRRAHFRTLKAARFTYARGKRVFVRQAWVGPKEWKDAGSRQIYRILEPVDPSASSHR